MKYYVVADIHSYYSEFIKALTEKGFFEDNEPHKLIICGDLLDRGTEPRELINFVLELAKKDEVILIRGNHEDLMETMLDDIVYGDIYEYEMGKSIHVKNRTFDTALRLTGLEPMYALAHAKELVAKVKQTEYYKKLLPMCVDYFETEHFIFTHGYIPCKATEGSNIYRPYKRYYFNKDWRNASNEDWRYARWYNGMEFACKRNLNVLDKTVVCGHWNCSYGHAEIDHKCSEFGKDADFSPYYGEGIIGIDACTAFSGKVNCIVIED